MYIYIPMYMFIRIESRKNSEETTLEAIMYGLYSSVCGLSILTFRVWDPNYFQQNPKSWNIGLGRFMLVVLLLWACRLEDCHIPTFLLRLYRDPEQVVQLKTCHALRHKRLYQQERMRANWLCSATLAFSHGVPLFHAGTWARIGGSFRTSVA